MAAELKGVTTAAAGAVGQDTSAFGVVGRPNWFEVFLCTHLESSLRSVFRQLAKAALRRDWLWGSTAEAARVRSWLRGHLDAVYVAAAVAVEAHHLWRHDATLAERFLGLRRVSAATATSAAAPPTSLQRAVSVVLVVLAPLAGERLLKLAQRYSLHASNDDGDDDNGSSSSNSSEGGDYREGIRAVTSSRNRQGWLTRMTVAVCKAAPFMAAAVGIMWCVYAVAYIGNLTRFATPALHIARLRLVASSPPHDAAAAAAAVQQQARGVARRVVDAAGDALRLALPLAAFGYRSLEWWYSMPQSVLGGGGAGDAVPPAPEAPALVAGVTVPAGERCPLCGRARTNAAVLAASGFAFCYPCIVHYVREHGRCPVTGLPATEPQIRRLFSR